MSVVISCGRAMRVFCFLLVLTALPVSMHASVTVISGTAVTTYGPAVTPNFSNASIAIQGQNFSLSGSVSGGCKAGITMNRSSGNVVSSETIAPTCTDLLTGQSLAYGPALQLVYNGTTYTSGAGYSISATLNFSGPSVTVPNAVISEPAGNYSGTVANIPFSMTGTVTVTAGGSSGGLVLSIPVSGSGAYSADQYGDLLASGPGGIPSGTTTYQFKTLSSTMYGLDGTTGGAWIGKYGADGYLIANGPTSSPAYAYVNVAGDSPYTWAGQVTDPRALTLPGTSNAIASAYTTQYPNQSFTINVSFTDGKTHRVALYALDWDSGGRTQTVTITDASSNAVLDTEVLSNFQYGQYATWNLAGSVVITVTPNPGQTAVISGIFFDPVATTAPSPSFTLSATAASIAAGSSSPATVTVTPLNGFSSAVTLAATAWPAGITGTFTTNPTTTSSSVNISVASSVASGNYSLTVTGTSGSLSATTTIALTVTAALSPSFTISAAPVTIAAEAIGSSTVTVTPMNGFNGVIGLAAGSGWPTGITASSGTVIPPTSTTGGITIYVAGGVAAGTYSLPITASSGSLTASTNIKLTVTAGTPSFTISAAPVSIAAGSSGSSTVTAVGINAPVTLAVSGVPTGITVTTTTVTPTSAGSVAISVASGVTPGAYSLTLIGTETPISYLTTISLTVTAASSSGSSAVYTGLDSTTQGTWTGKYGGDGFLIANDASSSLPSYAATTTVTGAATYTWAGLSTDPRALQAGKGFSSGIASSYYANAFNINVNLTDSNTHQVGLYLLDWDSTSRAESIVVVDAATNTVLDQESFSGFHNGQWAVWNIKGSVILKVTSNTTNNAVISGIFFGPASGTTPSPSFTLSATAVSVAAGSSGASTVSVNPLNGFNSTVSLAATAWPSGITGIFTPTATPTSSSVSISVASSVAPGNYSLTVTGTTSTLSATTTIPLTVTAAAAPSFTISAAPVTIAAEAIGSSTVTVTPMNGFNGVIGLAAGSGWPAGITASSGTVIPPTSTTGGITIYVAGGVAAGTYSLPITASSGSLTASTNIKLTVTAGTPMFTISAAPVSIAAGSSGSSTVTAVGINATVTLAVSGVPTGITVTTTTVTPTTAGSVAISVASGVAPGAYSLTLIGTETPISYLTTISLTVTSGGGSTSGSSAVYTGLDSTTEGAWNGKYGSDGFLIANDVSSSLPSYAATTTITGASTYTWAGLSTDPRALQAGKGFSSGIASQYYGSTFNINVNLTDGNTHQVGLYLLDWDSTSRAESIAVMDAATNTVLDQESFSGFHNGQWAVWNIKGNVILKVTQTGASNATVSGIFFGPASGTTPSPGFTLSATAVSVAAGSSGASTVAVIPVNGFISTVSLAATAWPTGITGIFTPTATPTSSSVSISVASSVAPGNYSLTVTGTGATLSATTTIPLTVTAAAAPSFTISGAPVTIAAEAIGSSTVTITALNGFNGLVSLAAPGWPTGITPTIGVSQIPSTTSGLVSINVAGGVAAGTYSLPVTATSGSLTASTNIKLTVTAGTPLFTISATPVTIAVASSGSSTVTYSGFTQQIVLATTGLPSGITATSGVITPPATSAGITISVAAGVTPGVYSLTLIGTETPISYLTTISLTVTSGGGSTAGSSAVYTGLDSTTQGAWNGKYGSDGFLIANDVSSSLPSYAATTTITGASTYTWAGLSTDPRALQAGKGFSSGIASQYYGSTFNINVNLSDGNTHQVGVYLLDWDSTSRAESIVVMDAATNMVLDQESFSGFHNGQWALWNIKGNVILKVTQTSGSNATVSGIFFGPASTGGSSYPLTAGLNVAISQLNGATEVVQADPSSSVVSSSDTVTYLVKWGDGQSNTATVNAPFSHTYATPGTYTVTLTLSDTVGETSSASQSITTQTVPTKNYGAVAFGANTPAAGLVGLTTTLIVPAKPPAVGTLFLWPGIQPNPNSPSFNPIGNGVLQPVLTWGNSCVPITQPAAYSTWWISGQYVNTDSTDPIYQGTGNQCFSGPAISVNVGDSLLINMTLSGTVWTQTITDVQTAQTTSFNYDLGGQQQGYLYFFIEEYSGAAPVTPVQFNNTTFTFSNSTGASCFPLNIGVNDSVSAPQLKSNGTQCFVPSITLRGQGIN